MFGKRQILIGLCAVVLSGSVIASDNSSALHGQDKRADMCQAIRQSGITHHVNKQI